MSLAPRQTTPTSTQRRRVHRGSAAVRSASHTPPSTALPMGTPRLAVTPSGPPTEAQAATARADGSVVVVVDNIAAARGRGTQTAQRQAEEEEE
eukprot:CAMPEP_0170269734 /NCGR_PEP_ID=MMETSP0116_2-20130129/34809_1 /TAXON_ID=400756 /ORGANISM="Durinskia baltica, Strain CSIRO CS-38" /LENGTH=93 /DNA_ID=CAMNT_0010520921 /DNA_START=15 /DNA_END=292 /DNA_ORIENTATION=+